MPIQDSMADWPQPPDPPAPQRKPVHAYLSPAAHERLYAAADERGCSVSALLEAIAIDPTALDALPETVTSAARGVDARRRRRGAR